MRERGFFFGEHGELFGICTEPAEGAGAEGRPAVLLLNAGVVHRVGPHRKSVKIARRLAAEGFLVMRFDQAGIGDSEPRRDALPFEEGAIRDVKEGMDHLQRTHGARRFVLMGLCSGADTSFQATCRDERVVGAVLMDGYAYPTPEMHVRWWLRRLGSLQSWRVVAARRAAALWRRARGTQGAPAPAGPDRQYVRERPPKERFVSDLRRLVARGVKLHFIYSSGMPEYYNYEGQLLDALRGVDLRGHVTSEMFRGANHTFTELSSQEALVSAIVRWMIRLFDAEAPRVEGAAD